MLERIYNPFMAMGFGAMLPFSLTTLRYKHCQHPIAIMGVVDMFGQCGVIPGGFSGAKYQPLDCIITGKIGQLTFYTVKVLSSSRLKAFSVLFIIEIKKNLIGNYISGLYDKILAILCCCLLKQSAMQ